MPSTLIQNGTILDPSQKLQRRADLLVRNGRVAAIGTNLGKADEVIDAVTVLSSATVGILRPTGDGYVLTTTPAGAGRRLAAFAVC